MACKRIHKVDDPAAYCCSCELPYGGGLGYHNERHAEGKFFRGCACSDVSPPGPYVDHYTGMLCNRTWVKYDSREVYQCGLQYGHDGSCGRGKLVGENGRKYLYGEGRRRCE